MQIIIGVALIIKDRRAEGLMVILGIMFIPCISTNALVDIKININANVRIIPGEDKICVATIEGRIALPQHFLQTFF